VSLAAKESQTIANTGEHEGPAPVDRESPVPLWGAGPSGHHAAAAARVRSTTLGAPATTQPTTRGRPRRLLRKPLRQVASLCSYRTWNHRRRGRTPASLIGIVAAGLAVGFLTGFFGVGGGFVIVPALVLVLGLPIQQAVGTSLLIAAANSATSLVARVGVAQFDWSVIIPFTLAAVAATLVGKQVADRLPARYLKVGFVALLVLVAGYTAWQSILGLANAAAASTSVSTVAPAGIATVSPIKKEIARGAPLIDVRSPGEYAVGHLAGAQASNSTVQDSTPALSSWTAARPTSCTSPGRRRYETGAVVAMVDHRSTKPAGQSSGALTACHRLIMSSTCSTTLEREVAMA
jgi:hypothetical protein